MDLLREYFDGLLVEEWGNLKFIDKDMMKVFGDKSSSMHSEIGRNSEVKLITVGNASKAFAELEADDAIGMVYYVGADQSKKENQMFAVGKIWIGAGRKGSEYNIALRGGFLTGSERDFMAQRSKISSTVIQADLKDGIKRENNIKEADMRMLILRVMKSAEAVGKTGHFVIIKKDKDRPVVSSGRKTARQGLVLTPKQMAALTSKSLQTYISAFKNSLKERLKDYKNNSVAGPSESDPASVMEWIMKNGYLDKIKINGYVYNYFDDSFRFGQLRKGVNDQWNSSYVTYVIEENEKYETDRRVFRNAQKEFMAKLQAEGKTEEQIYAAIAVDPELQKLYIPRRFSIFFKIDGASVVPSHIEFKTLDY